MLLNSSNVLPNFKIDVQIFNLEDYLLYRNMTKRRNLCVDALARLITLGRRFGGVFTMNKAFFTRPRFQCTILINLLR